MAENQITKGLQFRANLPKYVRYAAAGVAGFVVLALIVAFYRGSGKPEFRMTSLPTNLSKDVVAEVTEPTDLRKMLKRLTLEPHRRTPANAAPDPVALLGAELHAPLGVDLLNGRRGIFAVGDVHGDIKLIAVAWAEGIQAAIHAFNEITSPYWLNEKRLKDHKIALIGEKIARAASRPPTSKPSPKAKSAAAIATKE